MINCCFPQIPIAMRALLNYLFQRVLIQMFLAFMNQIVSIFGGNNYENKKAVINNFIICNNINNCSCYTI